MPGSQFVKRDEPACRVGLLSLLPFDRLPLEKPVDRDDAAPSAIGVAKDRQRSYRLALGVDQFAPAFRFFAPIGNETPPQGVERHLAGLMIAPNHQQVLARCAVPARRIVVYAAVAHIHAGDDAVPQWSAALDDPPAHGRLCGVCLTTASRVAPTPPALRPCACLRSRVRLSTSPDRWPLMAIMHRTPPNNSFLQK